MVEQLQSKMTLATMLEKKAPGLFIQEAKSFTEPTGLVVTEYKDFTKTIMKPNLFLKHIKSVQFSNQKEEDHALIRWNMRVGPIIDAYTLLSLMEYVIRYESDRITLEDEHFAYLDSTICFYYSIEEDVFLIHTFYGRSNLRPSIANVVKMKTYNMIQADQVNLTLTAAELAKQELPFMPKSIVRFSDTSGKVYELLHFNNSEHAINGFFYFFDESELVYSSPLYDMTLKTLPYNFLHILYLLGYEKIVMKNLYYNPDLLKDLTPYYTKNAIRTFKFWLGKQMKN